MILNLNEITEVHMTKPLLHSINSTTEILAIGRSSLYSLIAEGKIRPVKVGRRTLIPDQEIRRFVEDLTTRCADADEQ